MRRLFEDTPLEVERVLLEGLRKRPPDERLRSMVSLTSVAWNAARDAVGRAWPEESQETQDRIFLEQHYGCDLAAAVVEKRRKLGFYNG